MLENGSKEIQNLIENINCYYIGPESADKDSFLLNGIIENYSLVTIYTIWESYACDLVCEWFKENREYVIDSDLQFDYLQSMLKSSETRKELKRQIENNSFNLKNIQIKEYIGSNNLWYKNFREIFKKFNSLNFDELKILLIEDSEMIDIMKSFNTFQYFEKNDDMQLPSNAPNLKSNPSSDIKEKYMCGYINALVNARNTLAHGYKSPKQNYDREELINIAKFISRILVIEDTFLQKYSK
ncbi:hypothetical protein LNP00_00375 [Fructobacillus sp. M158]|uniref:HEPN domain-containing protein n=1 Tax=Fructobacillus parabroussonetiae TaxID=2713174 RepID=UPI00200B6A0A|nr:HEPN domain-containing protein [Fructobacillus parabroussonetiae]MCK8616826.1 hypothetical protein [Fructobacillus parabroussonetiae]